jgi:hypothetical protein
MDREKAPGHRPISAQIKLNIHPSTHSPIHRYYSEWRALDRIYRINRKTMKHDRMLHALCEGWRLLVATNYFFCQGQGLFFNPVNPVNPVKSIVFFGFPDRIYRV